MTDIFSTLKRKRDADADDDDDDQAVRKTRWQWAEQLRLPVDPAAAPILIDAETGAPVNRDVQQFDEVVTSVLDEANGERALSDEAVTRLATVVLADNLLFDYFSGTWSVRLPTELINYRSELRDHDGMYVRDVLLRRVVADELFKAARDAQKSRSEQHRALLLSTAVQLGDDVGLRERLVGLLEWQMLWHAPPPPPVLPVERDPAYGFVVEWLVGVSGRRLVRRALPRICGPASYGSAAHPALLSNMWADFSRFASDARQHICKSLHFALLVADCLGEWPHQHRCFNNEPHWLGYEWHASKRPLTAQVFSTLRQLRQEEPAAATPLSKAQADYCRRVVQYHFSLE